MQVVLTQIGGQSTYTILSPSAKNTPIQLISKAMEKRNQEMSVMWKHFKQFLKKRGLYREYHHNCANSHLAVISLLM